MAPRQLQVDAEGTRLNVTELSEGNQPLVLVHGLAGYSGEWSGLAGAMPDGFHILAPDGRGHGRSERRPADLSRDAHVADVEAVIEACGPPGPVVLVGQSLGANTAMLVAARRPELVRALVVIEASPSADPRATDRISAWLARWPRPFTSKDQARDFFGGAESAQAWVAGLEEHPDGLWSRFDDDVLLACLDAAARRDWWSEWARITCPTLLVRGATGWLSELDFERMASSPFCEAVTISDAGHDVHLHQPQLLAEIIVTFLERHGNQPGVQVGRR